MCGIDFILYKKVKCRFPFKCDGGDLRGGGGGHISVWKIWIHLDLGWKDESRVAYFFQKRHFCGLPNLFSSQNNSTALVYNLYNEQENTVTAHACNVKALSPEW